MAGKVNFSVFPGDTFRKTATFRNKSTGVPVNLTGATISGYVEKDGVITNFICSLPNAAGGVYRFELASTVGMSGTYKHYVTVTYPDNTITTLHTGNLVIE